MNEQLMAFTAERAIMTPKGHGYVVSAGTGGMQIPLKRDIDFGRIPKTKKPSLYKSGAEKVVMAYGLLTHYDIESKIEDPNPKAPMFFYTVKCSLVKIHNGIEYVFTTGYGSANTSEKRNGFNSAFDAANSTLKMAQKRALVAAALSISGLSDAFTQDMENEEFMEGAKALVDTDKPDSAISTQQIRRLYAIGADNGKTAQEVKDKLATMGFTSTKQITQKDYERVCKALNGEEINDGSIS